MTPLTPPVDGDATEGLWLSISDLAELKGVSKQAVSKRLGQFADAGLVSTKAGPRNVRLVNVAEYDKAAGEIGDTLRASAEPDLPLPSTPAEPSDAARLTKERVRREGYEADLARIKFEEKQRTVLPRDEIVAVVENIATEIVRSIEQMPSRADDCAAAVAKDGAAGARAFLKALARDLCDEVAKKFDPNSVVASPGAGDGREDAEDSNATA